MVNLDVSAACKLVTDSLRSVADPEKAPQMQAYMKTEMPFYGVQKAGRTPIVRRLVKEYAPATGVEYEALVSALWALPHREEKYIALGVARHFTAFVTPERIPLYRRLIVEGAWWDFVDEVATKLIRHLVVEHSDRAWPAVEGWSQDDDLWLRRTAIICQIGAKERTDTGRLLDFCAAQMHETDFFIRKAIGWALREYAKTDPRLVADFVTSHRGQLSGLSYREATKHIGSHL